MNKPNLILLREGEPVNTIDFGTVPEGTKVLQTYQLQNTGDYGIYNINITLESTDVKLIEIPEEIKGGATKNLIVEYTANKDAETGLKTSISIKAKYKV